MDKFNNVLTFDFGKWQKHWIFTAVGKNYSGKVVLMKKPAWTEKNLWACVQFLENIIFPFKDISLSNDF